MATADKKVIKHHAARLTPKADTKPVTVQVDDSARLRQIRRLVRENNRSSLDENLVICQIYMESRFDANAEVSKSGARGLMQTTLDSVKQVYKRRKQKELGHMPSDKQTHEEFAVGEAMHDSPQIFDESTNIQLGTEYMQYCIDSTASIVDAYIKYRHLSNGIYYQKIRACAEKLGTAPESMQLLRDMVK